MKIERIEKLTRKWWFFAGLIALQFVVMPFSTKNFGFENIEINWGDSFTPRKNYRNENRGR